MTNAHSDAPTTYFRLSEESWAEIREAYRNGATARELAIRWRVSPTTIYRNACAGGWTKKKSSDAVARAHARAIAEEEAADLASSQAVPPGEAGRGPPPSPPPPPKAEAPWWPLKPERPEAWPAYDPDEDDPPTLARAALYAAGRALRAGKIADAERLCRLSSNISRLSETALFKPDDPPPEQGNPYLHRHELLITREGLFDLVQSFAEDMLLHGIHELPEALAGAAAVWRALVLGEEAEAADREAALARGWDEAIWRPDGEFREPLSHRRLARLLRWAWPEEEAALDEVLAEDG